MNKVRGNSKKNLISDKKNSDNNNKNRNKPQPQQKSDQVELLLPVQNRKGIKAAIGNADAVYFGCEALNMRMHADNFPLKNLAEIVALCHDNNMKCYLTTNVIMYDNEIDYMRNILQKAQDAEIDAIIVHDMGVLDIAKELGINFHCSTQMSISNIRAAKHFESLGAERIILARELSLGQIKKIATNLSRTKVEAFIHGAQCTSISGRCYFSAYCNEDPKYSANRGKCLQPCRTSWTLTNKDDLSMDYQEGFFLNSKDLCMIEYVPQSIESGIASFKVEGRMRDPHYVETVGECYREAIDSYYNGTFNQKKVNDWMFRLKSVYNRGFSTGFYFSRPTHLDITRDTSGNLATHSKSQIGKVTTYYRKIHVAKIRLVKGILRIGDTIVFEGGSNGTYLTQRIHSIHIKGKAVTETPKASPENPIIIGTKVNEPVSKNDWVYKYI